jgi:hypothetical protein
MGHVWTAPPWQELSELLQHWSGAVMCPACLCGREAAGHNALRGSGPNQKHAFKDALTHTVCPDPRIDLVCITSSVLANSFNFKRHRRCLSHLLESLCLTQAVYSISMPRSGRRPQHQKQTSRHLQLMSALPPKADIGSASPKGSRSAGMFAIQVLSMERRCRRDRLRGFQ